MVLSIINSGQFSNLAVGATITTAWEDVSAYTDISFALRVSDDGGNSCTVTAEFSLDASNVFQQFILPSSGNNIWYKVLKVISKFFRVQLVQQGAGTVDSGVYQTLLNATLSVPIITGTETLSLTDNTVNTRALMVGVTSLGVPTIIQQSATGAQIITPEQKMLTSFNELNVESLTPEIQLSFEYPFLDAYLIKSIGSGGSIVLETTHKYLNITADSNENRGVESMRYIKYRSGQGILGRFACSFSLGITNVIQKIGFGVVVSGTTHSEGYQFGYNGDTFAIFHTNKDNAGVLSTTVINQSEWNLDICNGVGTSQINLDPTRGNIYQIQSQHMSFGAVIFSIQLPSGSFRPVHIIQYPNSATVPVLTRFCLPVMSHIIATGVIGGPIAMRVYSVAAFTEGTPVILGPIRSTGRWKNINSVNAINPPYHPENDATLYLFSIKVEATIRGTAVVNTIPIRLKYLSSATNTPSITMFSILVYTGVVLTGSSFTFLAGTTIDGQKIVTYDLSATGFSFTSAQQLAAGHTGATSDKIHLDLSYIRPFYAGEIISVFAGSSGGEASPEVQSLTSLVWQEEL